jgi:enterochelin esterase family protein
MHPALQQLGSQPTAAAVEHFLAEQDFPLLDPRGATFIFHGEADAVYLQHWAYELPNAIAFQRWPGSQLWTAYLALAPGSRLEYKLDVVRAGHGEWHIDPLNPVRAHDPYGANSVCQAYGYERPTWTLPNPTVPAGQLDALQLYSGVFGQERTIPLYLPVGFKRRRRYPLLIAHDGADYLHYSQMKTVLDNLIAAGVIAPLLVAFSQPEDRLIEYTGNAHHARFLALELLPFLTELLPLRHSMHSRGLMGASLGAVASLHAAWRYPGRFGVLLLQSGSFAGRAVSLRKRDSPVFERVMNFVDAFRAAPGYPALKLFLSCGLYESLIVENRAMDAFLRDRGLNVDYRESYDGHNWENWRDHMSDGLSCLFPPQQTTAAELKYN